jgi:ribosomal protein S30
VEYSYQQRKKHQDLLRQLAEGASYADPPFPPKLGGQGGGYGHHQACPEPVEGMRRLMREHALAEPVFEELGSFFAVTFYGPGERILYLIPEEGVVDLRELGLNERQIEALRLMANERRELSNKEYRELFSVSRPTAARDLPATNPSTSSELALNHALSEAEGKVKGQVPRIDTKKKKLVKIRVIRGRRNNYAARRAAPDRGRRHPGASGQRVRADRRHPLEKLYKARIKSLGWEAKVSLPT